MSKSKFSSKRVLVIGIVAALVVGGGGAAFAYWSSTGSGTGAAETGTSTAFTVTSSAPTGAALVPGGTAQNVAFSVANPSGGPLTFASLVVTVAESDGSVWNDVAGCSAADYTVSTPTVTYGSIAGGEDVDGTVNVSMINSGSNQNACLGADVPLYFVAS